MKNYFKYINDGANRVFILQDGTRFDTRTGFPKNCLEVWKKGFNYLALLPEAVSLFEKEKVSEVIKLINISKSIDDINILALSKPESEKVKSAAESRILLLTNSLKK